MKRVSRVDLHAHTAASDGALTPAELVQHALDRGLSTIAVTDHDSTEGVCPALLAARGTPLTVLPGIELGVDLPDGEVHMLGYLLDVDDPALQGTLREMRAARVTRARRMVELLSDLGLPLRWEEIAELAGPGAVGRAHVALALLAHSYVSSINEAFDRYIGIGRPAYVERYRLTPVQAVGLVAAAGGVAVLAHPAGKSGVNPHDPTLLALLKDLKLAGLGGIEVYYYGYPTQTVRALLAIARTFDLVPTGGSDFHGRSSLTAGDLGSVFVPQQSVDRLLARANRAGKQRGT